MNRHFHTTLRALALAALAAAILVAWAMGNAWWLSFLARVAITATAALSLSYLIGQAGLVSFGHAAQVGLGHVLHLKASVRLRLAHGGDEFRADLQPQQIGQALGEVGAELLHRVQEALADFVGLQQGEAGAQRAGVFRADRADQDLASVAEADLLVPGRQAVAGCHPGIMAAGGLRK